METTIGYGTGHKRWRRSYSHCQAVHPGCEAGFHCHTGKGGGQAASAVFARTQAVLTIDTVSAQLHAKDRAITAYDGMGTNIV